MCNKIVYLIASAFDDKIHLMYFYVAFLCFYLHYFNGEARMGRRDKIHLYN